MITREEVVWAFKKAEELYIQFNIVVERYHDRKKYIRTEYKRSLMLYLPVVLERVS